MTWKNELANSSIGRDEFFAIYVKAATEKFAHHRITFAQPDILNIHVDGRGTLAVRLDNFWREWSRTGRAPELVDRHLDSVAATIAPQQARPSLDSVIPLIRDESYLRSMDPQKQPVCERLAADIWIVYAVDSPKATFPLSASGLQSLGLKREDLHALAMKNLPKVISRIEKHGNGPSFLLSAGNCYEASLLLIDGLWDQLQRTVTGDIVAVVPTRTIVLFTGAGSNEGISAMRERAKQVYAAEHHPVSQTLLRRNTGKWEPF
jgi:uncharacterized protein YtpQ (UPF0354 family)